MDTWISGNAPAVGGVSSPMLLRDGRNATQYGNDFGKEASRKCYIKYRQYCSYVASCNDIDVLQKERLSPGQLMPQHVQQLFSRKYGSEGSLDEDQLLMADKHHASYVVTQDDPPRSLAEKLAKVATMRPSAGSAEARVEILVSNLESFFVDNLQANAQYQTKRGLTISNLRNPVRCHFSRVAL